MKITLEDDDGNAIKLPMKRIVCPSCNGRGRHAHPAFANGIPVQDFADDPDFLHDYVRGGLDVGCEECGGHNVIEAPDEDRMSPELVARLHRAYAFDARSRAEEHSERMMGA